MAATNVLNNTNEIKKQLERCLRLDDNCSKSVFKNVSTQNDPQKAKPIQSFIMRIIEAVGISFGLFLLLPILLLIVAAIKFESEGPVLFKQRRIGKHGKEFYMYKFRSMYVDAEEELETLKQYNQTNDYMFKMFDDPRITRVGKFLRKYSLDELPQLINVVKGEMALVGFRPPIPEEVAKYKDWHHLRFVGMPGLTGPWQISGRSNIKNFDIVVELEYNYNKDWNILKDFEILFKTIPVVLLGKNAA